MSIRIFLIILFPLLLVFSCAGRAPYTYYDLGLSNYGDSKEYTQSKIKAEKDKEFSLVNVMDKGDVDVILYYLEFYVTENDYFVTKEVDYIAYAFDSKGRLLYWGSIDEFKRSNDKYIEEIGKKIGEYLHENKEL